MKDYKFNYKVVTVDELNSILASNRSVYVLDHVRSRTDKFVRVFKLNSGMIFQDSDFGIKGDNLDRNDLKSLYKEILSIK